VIYLSYMITMLVLASPLLVTLTIIAVYGVFRDLSNPDGLCNSYFRLDPESKKNDYSESDRIVL